MSRVMRLSSNKVEYLNIKEIMPNKNECQENLLFSERRRNTSIFEKARPRRHFLVQLHHAHINCMWLFTPIYADLIMILPDSVTTLAIRVDEFSGPGCHHYWIRQKQIIHDYCMNKIKFLLVQARATDMIQHCWTGRIVPISIISKLHLIY